MKTFQVFVNPKRFCGIIQGKTFKIKMWIIFNDAEINFMSKYLLHLKPKLGNFVIESK